MLIRLFTLIVLCLLQACLAQSSREIATRELEKSVIKPKFCGAEYFEALERRFQFSFNGESDPVQISQFCDKFANENDVTLNILNQVGIDMCSFRNPISNSFTEFFVLLNLRNLTDRYDFYTNVNYTFPSFPLNMPPIDSPYVDTYGLLRFYVQFVNPNANPNTNEALQANIYNITTYPDSGPQGVQMISDQVTITRIVASSTPSLENFSAAIPAIREIVPNFDDTNQLTAFFLEYLFAYASFDFQLFPELVPYPSNLLNLSNEVTSILRGLGTFGIAKNQASPLVVNVLQDGICYWGYNRVYPDGKMYRIVFSQSKNNLLFKK